jgi:hypothetical protein
MITYATNNPDQGYELMVSGTLPEKCDLTKYTHVWVYDSETFEDGAAPDWTKYPAFMDTLTMTTDQIHHLIDVLDEVLRQEELNYVEWCSAGNDPTDHLWYRAAQSASVLEAA